MRRWLPLLGLAALVPALPVPRATAQDSHYWTQQFGPRSSLLGGAVIGSVADLSAVYYNPGAMAVIDDPNVLVSAHVYERVSLRVTDGAGPGEDLASSRLSAAPDFVSGTLMKNVLGGERIAYSILLRQRLDVSVASRRSVNPTPPATGGGSSELLFDQYVSDTWIGVSWARDLGNGNGFGITTFVASRHQETRSEFSAYVDDTATLQGGSVLRNVDFSVWRVLAKFGYNRRMENATLGVSLTTPSLRMFGSGDYFLQSAVQTQDAQGLSGSYQSGVTANYQDPWSIGVGGSYTLGRTTFHGSAEWFSGVEETTVLELEPFYTQTTGVEYVPVFRQDLRPVWNAAVGVSHVFPNGFEVLASFATDHSANDEPTQTSANVSQWDLHHLSAGGNFRVGTVDLTLGLAYAFGSEDATRLGDFGSLIPPDGPGGNDLTRVDYDRLRFLFGFKVNL